MLAAGWDLKPPRYANRPWLCGFPRLDQSLAKLQPDAEVSFFRLNASAEPITKFAKSRNLDERRPPRLEENQ
jgi:hypothetical protein